jgi:hypothetical protein
MSRRSLRQLQNHLLGMHAEGGGDLRIDIDTVEQVNALLLRALQGDADAVHSATPLYMLFEQYITHGGAPCFACGGKSWPPGGVVAVGAFTLDPERVLGGVICQECIALPVERLRAQVLKVLGKVGIHPGPASGRNLHLDGGRA